MVRPYSGPAQTQAGEEASAGDPRSIRWYHSIQLGDTVTPGIVSPSVEQWTLTAMPADLSVKAVLDVGAWDGYYSFEAERRGASSVLAIDALQCEDGDVVAGFQHARAALGSKVDFRVMDVMGLDSLQPTFDVILFLGVYYHLTDPIHALRLLFDHLRPRGLLLVEGLVLPGAEPKLLTLRPEDLEPTTFNVPTLPWLEAALRQAGFQDIELLGNTGRIGDAMRYYRDAIAFRPSRLAFALANRVAWLAGVTRVPFGGRVKMYRGLLRAIRPPS